MQSKTSDFLTNNILVVGGGVAGIKAAMDLSEAGREVILIDKARAIEKSAGAVQMKSECPGADTSNRPSPSRVEPSRAQDPDREKGMLH